VLRALTAAGLGLDEAIRSVLQRDAFRRWGDVALPGCTLEVRRALEFWPLLGDAANPEQGCSFHLVDASTTRVELRLRPERGSESDGHGWQIITAVSHCPCDTSGTGRTRCRSSVCAIAASSYLGSAPNPRCPGAGAFGATPSWLPGGLSRHPA